MPLTPVQEEFEGKKDVTSAWPRTPYPFGSAKDILHTESLAHGIAEQPDTDPEDLALSESDPLLPYEPMDGNWLTNVPNWLAQGNDQTALEEWINTDEVVSTQFSSQYTSSCDCSECTTSPCQTSAAEIDTLPPSDIIARETRKAEDISNLRSKRIKIAEPLLVKTVLSPQTQPQCGTTPIRVPLDSTMVPTPYSPERGFVDILAERQTKEGLMYKIAWRDSWVHAGRLGNVESIRNHKMRHTGRSWEIVE